ncbi:MAG: membrane protein [Verrucomicrobiales bacterium]|nr:membrane protein [Verrucomicrobiales bacterium]
MSSDKSKNRPGKGRKKGRPQPGDLPAKPASKRPVDKYVPKRTAPSASTTAFVLFEQEKPDAKPVPRFFEKTDWIAFAVTTFLAMVGYYFTLAPDLTLEDSGELAVGSMYAGVPHPPGYPVWTLYTWFFAEFIPLSNIAWRVALSSAVAAAVSCGLIAMMISRGSKLVFANSESMKEMEESAMNPIRIVSGFVGGMLMGFNGFMWSQAVIVEVYTLSVLTLVLQMICLMRWMYAPHQYLWLFLSWFWAGICFTNHQTLIVALIGMEIAIMARDKALGRDRFAMNAVFYILAFFAVKMKNGWDATAGGPQIWAAFNCIGLFCLGMAVWLTTKTNALFTRVVPALCSYLPWVLGAAFYLYMPLAGMTNPPMQWGYPRIREGFWHALMRGQYEKANPTSSFDRFFEQINTYVGGAMEEFNLIYLLLCIVPVAVIFYRKLNPNQRLWLKVVSGLYTFFGLLMIVGNTDSAGSIGGGVLCGYLFLFLGIVPFISLSESQDRVDKAWLGGVGSMYLFLSLLLIFLLNPQPDRQSQQLNRVFFTASYVPISMFIGHGLALIMGALHRRYPVWRPWVIMGSIFATATAALALIGLQEQHSVAVMNAWYGLVLAGGFTAIVIMTIERAPLKILLALLCFMPGYTFMNHWDTNEQRNHRFGYWFGHDMFTPPFEDKDGKPLYEEMAKDAVLFGGTDPGRFCPTYMIFCESFTDPEDRYDQEFDRRDVYIITQNALADGTYLMYIRAHYNRSTQIDMPFFQEMLRPQSERTTNLRTNLLARTARPLDKLFTGIGDWYEKKRRAGSSFFDPDDFTDVGRVGAAIAKADNGFTKYLKENLSEKTREMCGEAEPGRSLAKRLARDFNDLLEKELIYETERFKGIELSNYVRRFLAQNPQSHTRIRLNRLILEEVFGEEAIVKSLGGLYPDMEIHTPSQADSTVAFETYVNDAQRRLQHDMQFPNEPKQIKQGENVAYDPASGRVSVSGQIAVMAINGLLTKNIFDKNPDHEFYVEESFPLDWMYPHLTPYGIIMKINRQQVPEFTQEIVDRDHEFWSQYSTRLVGDVIDYDTPIKEITDMINRVFLRRDYTDFKGDRKFIRDDNAKKAFSKLRSAIGGGYFWRINHAQAKGNMVEQARMIKEADFAFKQAFAFCPFSPEAVFRYNNLLVSLKRYDDALLITQTFLKFDPKNIAVQQLQAQLHALKAQPQAAAQPAAAQAQIAQLQQLFDQSPTNKAYGQQLYQTYMAVGNTNAAIAVIDKWMASPSPDLQTLLIGVQAYERQNQLAKKQLLLQRVLPTAVATLQKTNASVPELQMTAQAFNMTGQMPFLEQTMARLTKLLPTSPETWYDLSGIQVVQKKTNEALASLIRAVQLSDQRRATNPAAADLRGMAKGDGRFNLVRTMPGYVELMK